MRFFKAARVHLAQIDLCPILLSQFFYPYLRICLLIFREREEKGRTERDVDVRENHHLVAFCVVPDQGPNL